MSILMDMLVKSGYEAVSIGNDVLPCTLKRGDELIGFMMEDFSFRLLPEHETERDGLNKAVSFALENQDLEQIQGEFKLSQYRDTVLTATYNFDEQKPIYNIGTVDKDKNLILLDSMEDRDAAAKAFAERSGLVAGERPAPEQQDRIGKFIEAIKVKGFALAASVDDTFRAYDITDKDGKTVGFIGKNNRVTITSEDVKVKRTLSDAYIDTNPNRVLLPSFFERLKERLKEIGMALKVIFTRDGQHYSIHNEQHEEVATVTEQHEVVYTDHAKQQEMEKIDSLVAELRQERSDRIEQERVPAEEVSQPIVQPEVAAPERETTREQNDTPELAATGIVAAVLANRALTEQLVRIVLSDRTFLAGLNAELSEQISAVETSAPTKEISAKEPTPTKNPAQIDYEKKLSAEFEQMYSLLQTTSGFNPDREKEIIAQMGDRFGTFDPKEFQTKLQRGDYKAPDTLPKKIKESKHKAAELNAERQNAKQAQVKDKELA